MVHLIASGLMMELMQRHSRNNSKDKNNKKTHPSLEKNIHVEYKKKEYSYMVTPICLQNQMLTNENEQYPDLHFLYISLTIEFVYRYGAC